MKCNIADIEVEMDKEEFLDIVDIAGYGINYWCERAIVDSEEMTYELFFHDANDEKDSRIVTKHDLEKAISSLITGSVSVSQDIRSDIYDAVMQNDLGSIDALAGDVIVQTAVFNDIIFG